VSSWYIRVNTFDDDFVDVSREHVENVRDLKETLQHQVGYSMDKMKILYAGRELQNHESLAWKERVYVCPVSKTCVFLDPNESKPTL